MISLLVPVAILLAAGILFFALSNLNTSLTTLGEQLRAQPQGDQEETEKHESLRLQACERFTLLLERISVPNLLLRVAPQAEMTAPEYTATLLLAIRQEVEYNTTQQIYVSDALWSIIAQARDNVSLLITRAAEGADSAGQVADRLRHMSTRQPEDAIAIAQSAIRREASSVLGS